MTPWAELGRAAIPGGGELRLMRRGAELSIMSGNIELMNGRVSGSEEALATLACSRLRGRPQTRVLIGGLGMGFTLRMALAELGAEASVVVAELVPAIISWANEEMSELFGGSLADPRVSIIADDVGHLIRSDSSAYDAILLDVDNGPEGLTRAANDRLYDLDGLRAARAALRPGGVLALWSAGPNNAFADRLRQTGFIVEETPIRARRKRGGNRRVIWLATPN